MSHEDPTAVWWEAPWRFFVETFVGTIIFVLIAGAAVSLNFLVQYLEARKIDSLIVWGLKGAEYALFFVDLILFGRFLWKTLLRTWKRL